MLRKFFDVVKDKTFRMIVEINTINIINYTDIVTFDEEEIIIKTNEKMLKIKGKNLIIDKLLQDEVLVSGEITKIELI